jgi:serralysin
MRVLLISLIPTVAVILLLSLYQASWASLIVCTSTSIQCNGTSGDDLIIASHIGNIIHGLGGNDYIQGGGLKGNYIYGDDGDDRLIGSEGSDGLYGGLGNDFYDGRDGSDSIVEPLQVGGVIDFSNDVISGGNGDDYIDAGLGADRIHAGPGNDSIFPNGYHRDFSFDIVNCGSGASDSLYNFYSGDGDATVNCEFVTDLDG